LDALDKKIPLLAVVGPTASGKTALGVALAERIGGEVVSCDSMQLYRGMDIASAKPTVDEMHDIPHHMISVSDPSESYSVARYVEKAREVISDIYSRGKYPVLVGGTGLYYSSLVDGISFAEQPDNAELRRRLCDEAERLGNEQMLARLAAVDPDYAASLHPNNLKRVLRALEVYELTGVTMSEQLRRSRERQSEYDLTAIGIRFVDRELLYDRINLRVDMMLAAGLEEEARLALASGYATAAQAIGHKEFARFFAGECSREEAIESLKRETRRYAKRQMTWFSRDQRIHWIDADELDSKKILEKSIKTMEIYGKYDIIAL
jgi:tRNA dimethylallyltransferase